MTDGARGRKHPARPVRWRLEWIGVRTATAIVRLLPERWALRLGAVAGRAAAALIPRRREIALANLRLAYPAWSEARRAALARQNLEEIGRIMIEWSYLTRLSPDDVLARLELVGFEHYEAAVARGKGLLAVTAHYGYWELLPTALRARYPDHSIAVVGRPQRNPLVYEMIVRRRLLGAEMLPRDARTILRALRRGATIGVLIDQYTPKRRTGMVSPFFGGRVWTRTGPAGLARHTGAALVPVHIRRIAGTRHRMEFGPEIEVPQTGDRATDVAEGTARLNAAIESFIRAHPEHWLWAHRRFRRSPDVEGDPYAGL